MTSSDSGVTSSKWYRDTVRRCETRRLLVSPKSLRARQEVSSPLPVYTAAPGADAGVQPEETRANHRLLTHFNTAHTHTHTLTLFLCLPGEAGLRVVTVMNLDVSSCFDDVITSSSRAQGKRRAPR